ncbi:MAG: 50S ribosomal protein L25 [Candidatus Eremiobacteraeota bacterium]|nr:50S ribosomal protein L25 [Candidatus Eremiobacteraeota bacterium]
MATKTQELKLELRDKSGTSSAQRARSEGRVPGVLYGHGQPPVAVAIDAKALGELLHGRRGILDVTLDGTKDTAIIRELQLDPVTRRVLNVDLQRVSRTEVISATVRIVTVGTPAGVREQGGVLDVVAHEIDVLGPADQIPDEIRVDVSALTIGHHVTAGELELPQGFKLDMPADATIAAVEAPRVEEEVAPDLTQATPEAVTPEGEAPAEGGAAPQ